VRQPSALHVGRSGIDKPPPGVVVGVELLLLLEWVALGLVDGRGWWWPEERRTRTEDDDCGHSATLFTLLFLLMAQSVMQCCFPI
jgi:hypothetical protein